MVTWWRGFFWFGEFDLIARFFFQVSGCRIDSRHILHCNGFFDALAFPFGKTADMADYKDVPPEFLCPVSMEIMRNPALNEAGQTYEYQSIVEWYAGGHRTDPLINKAIKNVVISDSRSFIEIANP